MRSKDMVRPRLYLMCGLPYSGKSTLARMLAQHAGTALLAQDDTWFEFCEAWGLDEHSDADWERVLAVSYDRVRALLAAGTTVVFDDASLTATDRDRTRALANACGSDVVLIYLDTEREVRHARAAQSRITNDRHEVPESIVLWAEERFEIPGDDERPIHYRPDSAFDAWVRGLP